MQRRKQWISILAGLLALVMVLGLVAMIVPTPASAANSSSEIKKQLDELKADKAAMDAKIKELEGKLSDNLKEMEKMVAQKDIIDQEIFMLHEQVLNINEQISAYSLLIADKQEELEAAQARLEELNKKNKERIRAMEEDGTLSYWSVLFQANDFSDLLDRLNMIEEIAASDQRRLKELSQAAELVANAKAELETERAALEQTKQELNQSQEKLELRRAEADELLAQLLATGDEYQKLVDAAEEEASRLDGAISDKNDEYEKKKYQEWLATSVPPTTKEPSYSSGGTAGTGTNVDGITWLVPCNYILFTSAYGNRVHPITGKWSFHDGVDLAAKQGTPIIASRSGVVDEVGYGTANGYYVYIDHMDGFQTRYLHMTHYIVKKGDYVTAGQVIGYMGSTGWSTGPHLHFGIYYNGKSVNPANYISIR